MSDWKPQFHKRKRHFKWSLILSRTPRASRISLSLQMSQKSLCSSFGILSRRYLSKSGKGVNFTEVPDEDTTTTLFPPFLIKLGYKGPLYKHTNMFVDHMHQPWRYLRAIINKCLSGKTACNDKLHIAYQIDHMNEKRSRQESMPFPRFTKEYGLSIPKTMLTEAIKQSESYQMFIKYYTSKIPPKKSRGKGSQRKKTADDSQETVDVFEESEPEPESVKRKTSSKRKVKKKVTLSANDNIISNDPDTTLELGKSISQTEVEEAEAARQVHATHARIVTESVPESAKKKSGGRSSKNVFIQDTPKAANIMQALKESKKTSKRQPSTEDSNEGTGTIPGVPNESIVVSATSNEGSGTIPGVPNESTVVSATLSEGTGTKPGVLDEEKDITKELKT
ncbi:hypothetical protein Tco_1276058 [Tanacetum coccineum]